MLLSRLKIKIFRQAKTQSSTAVAPFNAQAVESSGSYISTLKIFLIFVTFLLV